MSTATTSCETRLLTEDAPEMDAMTKLPAQYPRYGYERVRGVPAPKRLRAKLETRASDVALGGGAQPGWGADPST